jgi:glycosyltransferase involved in cell wall biosynthesis
MVSRKRVLFISEASFLSTGFSTLSLEIMKRLHATSKYELAELAGYGEPGDPRGADLPWTYIPVKPDPRSKDENERYNSHPINQFGLWKFEEACLQHRPDVVCTFRDPWYDSFVETSPFRRFYRHVAMPTCDAEPLLDDWVAQYLRTDHILGYTDWGVQTMRKHGLHATKAAPPGADFDTYQVVRDKSAHKERMGLRPDILVVGMVARNQVRKLYPDLFEGFALFLKEAPRDLAEKTYLYLHTAWPDLGYDIPRLIAEYGIPHKVLMTYFCRNCHAAYPGFFQDCVAICKACGKPAATFPTTYLGVKRSTLNDVYNLLDVFVQMSSCLPRGSRVLLSSGWTKIEDVKVGDMAFTHMGRFRRVKQTFERKCNRLITFRCFGDYEELQLTPEHPIYCILSDKLKNSRSLREKIGDCVRYGYRLPKAEFVEASKVTKGSLFALPIDDSVEDVEQVDWASYDPKDSLVLESYLAFNTQGLFHRFTSVTDDFCRFLGLFAADGCCSGMNMSVTLGEHETAYHELCLRVFNGLSPLRKASCYRYKDRKAVTIIFNSAYHRNIFFGWFSKGAGKKLPDWVMGLPPHKQLCIIQGLCMGDGHYSKDAFVTVYTTISPLLADQMKTLLRRCRLDFNCRRKNRGKGSDGKVRRPQYTFEIATDVIAGDFDRTRTNTRNIYLDGYHMVQVKEVKIQESTNDVFNFEVEEDNSYVTPVSAVHNCEGLGMPQVEAAACGVPVMSVNYSGMVDIINKLGATPIAVKGFHRDVDTGRKMAYPDVEDFVGKLINLLSLPESVRRSRGYAGREAAKQHFNWDTTAKVWEEAIDGMGASHPWTAPLHQHASQSEAPEGLTNDQFVRWALTYVAGRPDLVNSYTHLCMLRDLNWGASFPKVGSPWLLSVGPARQLPFGREEALKVCKEMCENGNVWERRRAACCWPSAPLPQSRNP